MRILLPILVTLLPFSTWANMVSPIQEGSLSANPFISQSVDIVKEEILIVPDAQFLTAQFKIEYHIKANKTGRQIPLLFYASEFSEHFNIWIDDKAIELQQVPDAYMQVEGTAFSDFGYFFDPQKENESQKVLIKESSSSGFYVSIDDLKFFEADLSKGNHIIRVEYLADRWVDRSGWIRENSFRYALAPAKYWKSFGDLEITLDASNVDQTLITNLGPPKTGSLDSKAVWTFSALPTEVLQISYQAEMKASAKILLALSPIGLTLLLAFLLVSLHIFAMIQYRKTKPDNASSWIRITGSILIPFLTLLGYMCTFDFIDAAIGPEASKYHGYTFFILLLYPILLPLYWIMMRLLDKAVTKKIRERRNKKSIFGSA